VTVTNAQPPFPKSKISEVFLWFAAPLLNGPADVPLREQLNAALKIAFVAWNAVVYADAVNHHEHLNSIRHLLRERPEVMALVNQMIARKRTLFSNDHRLIGRWEITTAKGEIRLWAEARNPHTPSRSEPGTHGKNEGSEHAGNG